MIAGDVVEVASWDGTFWEYSRRLEVTAVEGPCTCSHVVDQINGMDNPQPAHYHIAAIRDFFNWIDADGRCIVSGKWRVRVVGKGQTSGQQLELML